MEWNVDNTEQL